MTTLCEAETWNALRPRLCLEHPSSKSTAKYKSPSLCKAGRLQLPPLSKGGPGGSRSEEVRAESQVDQCQKFHCAGLYHPLQHTARMPFASLILRRCKLRRFAAATKPNG